MDLQGECGSEEEAFGLKHENFGVVNVLESVFECVDDKLVDVRVGDDGEDVDEADSGFREVGIGDGGLLDFV